MSRRGFTIEDARGFYLPHLRVELTNRNTFVVHKDGQDADNGVEIKEQDARELAKWLLRNGEGP